MRQLALAALFAIGPAALAQSNLVANPGFEASDGWAFCGSARIVDANDAGVTNRMVRSGRFALRVSSEDACGSFSFEYGTASQSVTIPSDAPALTLSFWYSRVGDPGGDLEPQVGDRFQDTPTLDAANLPGWHHYRVVLNEADFTAVRGQTVDLIFVINGLLFSSGDPADEANPGYYIDDVRLVAADETTADRGPPPSELAADGSAPIVYVDVELGGVARMEADGSNRQLVPGVPDDALLPVWAGRDRILAIAPGLEGSLTDFEVNPARISIVYAVPADGGSATEIYRTVGDPGIEPISGVPPARPALDVVARAIDVSPDGTQIVLGVCSQTRFKNGTASDEICTLRIVDLQTQTEVGQIGNAFRPNWSSTGQIAFEDTQGLDERSNGIWTVPVTDLEASTLILPSVEGSLGLSAYEDVWATWSPDGSQFVTLRDVDGGVWTEGSVLDFYRRNREMALHNADGTGSRSVLLLDHGTSPAALAWSPDGQFLLYTLFQGSDNADLWWLRLSDGATGRLTTNGQSASGDWRPSISTASSEGVSEPEHGLAVYPSPASGTIRVTATLDSPARVRLTVVDALGREVIELANGASPAGEWEIETSVSPLPPGLYLVVLSRDGMRAHSRQLVVVR